MRTKYRIDTFQKTYFVIDDFAQLFALADVDGRALAARPAALPEFAAGAVLETDRAASRHGRRLARRRGRVTLGGPEPASAGIPIAFPGYPSPVARPRMPVPQL